MVDLTRSQWEEIAGFPTQTGAAAASSKQSKAELVAKASADLNAYGGSVHTTSILNGFIDDILTDIEIVAPHIAEDTTNVTVVEDSKRIDLSGIAYMRRALTAEFEAGEDDYKKYWRNIEHIDGDDYELQINYFPDTTGDACYIRYETVHTLTDVADDSTLTRPMEDAVVKGLKFYALRGYARSTAYDAEASRGYIDTIPLYGNPASQHLNINSSKRADFSAIVAEAKAIYDQALKDIPHKTEFERYRRDP